jgi:hypothetical protein
MVRICASGQATVPSGPGPKGFVKRAGGSQAAGIDLAGADNVVRPDHRRLDHQTTGNINSNGNVLASSTIVRHVVTVNSNLASTD